MTLESLLLVPLLLRHAASIGTSIRRAADDLDPDGERIDIAVVVAAIDAWNAVDRRGTTAGDYHRIQLIAAERLEADLA